MAALNFPASPAVNDIYPTPAVAGQPQYQWDGIVWKTGGFTPMDYVLRAGDTMTGQLKAVGNPVAAEDMARKAYVDNAVRYVGVHGSDIASAATIDLDAATGDLIDITGTTAITAITLADGQERTIRFTGALTFTHGASLVIPGGRSIITSAGDFAIVRGYSGGVVRVVNYIYAGVWNTYTPTLGALVGAFGSASATGKYRVIGKTVFLNVVISITIAGTAQHPTFTLPPGMSVTGPWTGVVSWHAIAGTCDPLTSTVFITRKYDNSGVAVSGTTMMISLVFQMD